MDKTYMDVEDLKVYQRLCKIHIEVVTRNARMLNGLEKSLEKHLPESNRRWPTEG